MSNEVMKVLEEQAVHFENYVNNINARMDDLEASANRPHNPNAGGTRESAETDKAMLAYLRQGDASQLKSIEGSVTIGTGSAGGVAVPQVIDERIAREMKTGTPWLDLCRVVDVASAEYRHLVSDRGVASGWVGETGSRSETNTPGFREVVPSHGELYASPKMSNWSIQDIQFNLEDFIRQEVASEFSYQIDSAVVSGDGNNTLKGFLDTTPESAGDDDSPSRTAGALQYIATGVSDGFGHDPSASPAVHAQDVLIDTITALRAPYRANAGWVMNSATLGTVLKWKDLDGRGLVNFDVTTGAPSTLMGYPIAISESMPDIAANSFPVAFGDFSKGYLLARYHNLSLIRDDVTSKGFTSLYFWRRFGGAVLNDQAIKLIKVATS